MVPHIPVTDWLSPRRWYFHHHATPLLGSTLLGSLVATFQIVASRLRSEQTLVDCLPLCGVGTAHQPGAGAPTILAQRRSCQCVRQRAERQVAGDREAEQRE